MSTVESHCHCHCFSTANGALWLQFVVFQKQHTSYCLCSSIDLSETVSWLNSYLLTFGGLSEAGCLAQWSFRLRWTSVQSRPSLVLPTTLYVFLFIFSFQICWDFTTIVHFRLIKCFLLIPSVEMVHSDRDLWPPGCSARYLWLYLRWGKRGGRRRWPLRFNCPL